ncbi:RNA polymerase sigma factor [Rhodocista pekingensis]|uniref:RNA polymerase sigma factor n=1 Tax=Rhodocista pekingensis TaxID=201185 RepID=A0ABW2KWD0_9PROT
MNIWQHNRAYLRALAYRWLAGNTADVEDALSDVFCKASRAFDQAQVGIANERAWLSRLLHNTCMDAHRRRRATEQVIAPAFEDSDETDAAAELGETASPEDELLNLELRRVLHGALADLPESLRGPAVMRLVEDEPYERIAAAYNISLANARKRIQLARAALRSQLTGYLTAGEAPRAAADAVGPEVPGAAAAPVAPAVAPAPSAGAALAAARAAMAAAASAPPPPPPVRPAAPAPDGAAAPRRRGVLTIRFTIA